MDKKNIYMLTALILVFVLILSVILLSPTNVPKDEKTIIGKLSFPMDEGSHEAIQESWVMYVHGVGDDGEEYSVTSIWNKQWINMQRMRGFQIYLSRNNELVDYEVYTDFRENLESNASLDIEWISEMGGVMHFKRDLPNTDMESARYTMQFINEDSYLRVDVDGESQRNVTLFGLDGDADMGLLGGLKGYLQPDMRITGTIFFNGREIHISGIAAYTHLWGYLPTDHVSFSSMLMKGEEKTFFFFRTYLNGVNVAWEYFYLIDTDGYTLFITHYDKEEGESTIGASVDSEYHIKDLEGERYDATVLDYFLEPANPDSHRCYPDHWFFKSYYDNYSCVCAPSDLSSSRMTVWEGFMEGVDGENHSLWGFEHIYTYWMSKMGLNNISFEKNGNSVDVIANVSSSLPLNAVVLEYGLNVSGIWENHTEEMTPTENGWQLTIETPPSTVSIRVIVHMEDKSYRWEMSEAHEYILRD